MNRLLLILIFIVELLKYSLGLILCFNARRKWKWVDVIAGFICVFVLFSMKLQSYEFRLIMMIIILITMMITLQEKMGKRVVSIIMMLFVITCMDGIFEVPMNHIGIFRENVYADNVIYLSSSMITMIVISTIIILKKKRFFDCTRVIKWLQGWIPIMVLIMAIFLLFTIAGLNYANTKLENEKFAIFVSVVSTIALSSVGFLGVFLIYFRNTNEKMEEFIEIERNWNKMSINNYQLLLEKEEDTRRYRHDLNNHLICLRELAQSQKLYLINNYIDIMQGQMNVIQHKCYNIGNEVLNAILNYYLPMVANDVKITVTGCCSENLGINNMDLCTIFSNLIQNAVEGLCFDGTDEKYLMVHINQGNDYIKVIIRNSIYPEQKDQKVAVFKSKKSDSKNHGIGLRNVKETVKKNHGQFQITIEDNEVVSQVILSCFNKNRPYTESSNHLRRNTGNP